MIMTVEQAPEGVGDDFVSGTGLELNSPNPFDSETSIRFTTAKPGPLTLAVYDVQGREVRRLADGLHEASVYTLSWDGRDELGRPMPSGVYLYSLTTPEQTYTRKMVLTR
jgi:flagellar hook assembly protein FlgD